MSDSPDDAQSACSDSKLGYFLAKARNVLVQRMDIAVKPLGLTAPQIGVIMMLGKGYARTPFELARGMAIDSGSVTRMLDRLEKKGFISRARSGADRRVVELKLTERGAEAARVLPTLRDAAMSEQLKGFSPEEERILASLLERFIANGLDGETVMPGRD